MGAGSRKRGLWAELRGDLLAEAGAELDRLAVVATESVGAAGAGLPVAETAIRTAMLTLGGSLLERLLGADPGYRGPRVECGAGHVAGFVGYRDKTIDTVLGPVTLARAYYHCRSCGHGVIPRDDQLDVAGRSESPGLARMIARAGMAEPFAGARELLAELAGVALSTKRVERCAEIDGQAAARAVAAEAVAIANRTICLVPPAEPPDTLYVTIDGTGCPMVPAATAGRAGKGPDGKARTREIKLACCFTQTELDEAGYPIRDEDSASYVASFDPAETFGQLMAAEAQRRGIGHVRQPVIIGDGAPWIWNLAERHFPAATGIVDLYHAREHLHELAGMIAFMHGGPNTDPHHDWLNTQLARLDAGRIEALCNAAYDLPIIGGKAADRDKALAYFENNAHRMQYARFRDHGLFVGSGMVEAGCKAVIGQRLKQSGMRWTTAGATGILTLRTHHASGRFDQIWQRPHNQTLAA